MSDILSTSTHSTDLRSFFKAIFKTSSAVSTVVIFISSFTFFGISTRSFLFSFGIKTSFMPALCAASNFYFKPPIGKTCPVIVTSPVIAMSLFIGILVIEETIEVTMAIPADGPSFGVAPSGT